MPCCTCPSAQRKKVLKCHVTSPSFYLSVCTKQVKCFLNFFCSHLENTQKQIRLGFAWLNGRTLAIGFRLAFWFQAEERFLFFFPSEILGGDWLTAEKPYLLKTVVNLTAKTCTPQGRLCSPIHRLIILLSYSSPAFSLTWYWKFIKRQYKMLCLHNL